ncbi:hypothetical protein KAI46_10185 [bacterium]|nr:hypothetical protein [bacterium]
MALDSFSKQAYEVFWISSSFANDLGTSEAIVISSSAVTVTDKDGTDVTSDVIVAGTLSCDSTVQITQVQIKGGDEAASPYKITFRIVTDSSPANKWENDIKMKVKEL